METEETKIDNFISWLETRIAKTEKQKLEAVDLNLRIGKGGKLCVYKECLNYIKEHR